MKLEAFHIFLNESPSGCSPVSGLSGGVVINPGMSAMETQGLVLKFKGSATVHWVQHRTVHQGAGNNSTTSTVTDHYRGFSSIFDLKIYLLGDGHGITTLSLGETIFPFNFPVDFTNAPGTFEGKHGKVEYVLKATLKRKGLFADCKTKRDVHVNPVLDLNRDPMFAQPWMMQKSKTFCCFCCASGPLSMVVKLGAIGYCVGQGISVLVEVNNASTRNIKNVTAQLIQEITYRASNGTKKIREHYQKENSEQEVGPGNCEVWQGSVAVPMSVVPTRLGGGCDIIDVQYRVEVVAHVGAAGANLEVEVPVTIGTIPITNRELNGFAPPASAGFTFSPSAPPE